jgi:homoserine kinase
MQSKDPKIVRVRVPATSANCGPGFDSLGLAVNLYNTFTYELLSEENLVLEVKGEGAKFMKAQPKNLAFLSFYKLWNKVRKEKVGLKIQMENKIPLARGLGSSSSAIVAGLTAANALTGNTFSAEDLIAMATEIEGHPDNVAPAILGGFTISFMEDGKAHSVKLMPAKPFSLIALIPNMPLATSKARAALPKKVPMEDAVFSMSRASLLVACLLKGKFEDLHLALEDKLHQPYRLPLIPGAVEAIEAARKAGAYQGIISGAGSTLMAYAPAKADTKSIGEAMVKAMAQNDMLSRYLVLKVDTFGAKIL